MTLLLALRELRPRRRIWDTHTFTPIIFFWGCSLNPKSIASKIFKGLGVGFTDVYDEAKNLTTPELADGPTSPFSTRTARIFAAADAMAKEQGAEHVSTKHTLMALINDAVQDKENSRVAKSTRSC